MEIVLELDAEQMSAALHCMATTEAKTKASVKQHGKLLKAIKKNVSAIDSPDGGRTVVKPGKLEMHEDRLTYLAQTLDDRISKGIPGDLSDGYDSLLETVEAAKAKIQAK